MCPCACSPEGLTVSIRRPGREGVNATGRGVLSMSGLSHGVVRVDQENSLTSLTLQVRDLTIFFSSSVKIFNAKM